MKVSPVSFNSSGYSVNCLNDRNTAFGAKKKVYKIAEKLLLMFPANEIKGSLVGKKLIFDLECIDDAHKRFFSDFDFGRPVIVFKDNNFNKPKDRAIEFKQGKIKSWGMPENFLTVIRREVLQLIDFRNLTDFSLLRSNN